MGFASHDYEDHEIEYEGQELYLHFFHDRLRHEGLDDDDDARPALEVLGDHADQERRRDEAHVPESVRSI